MVRTLIGGDTTENESSKGGWLIHLCLTLTDEVDETAMPTEATSSTTFTRKVLVWKSIRCTAPVSASVAPTCLLKFLRSEIEPLDDVNFVDMGILKSPAITKIGADTAENESFESWNSSSLTSTYAPICSDRGFAEIAPSDFVRDVRSHDDGHAVAHDLGDGLRAELEAVLRDVHAALDQRDGNGLRVDDILHRRRGPRDELVRKDPDEHVRALNGLLEVGNRLHVRRQLDTREVLHLCW